MTPSCVRHALQRRTYPLYTECTITSPLTPGNYEDRETPLQFVPRAEAYDRCCHRVCCSLRLQRRTDHGSSEVEAYLRKTIRWTEEECIHLPMAAFLVRLRRWRKPRRRQRVYRAGGRITYQAPGQTCTHTGRQTGRLTDRQTDRQIDIISRQAGNILYIYM